MVKAWSIIREMALDLAYVLGIFALCLAISVYSNDGSLLLAGALTVVYVFVVLPRPRRGRGDKKGENEK